MNEQTEASEATLRFGSKGREISCVNLRQKYSSINSLNMLKDVSSIFSYFSIVHPLASKQLEAIHLPSHRQMNRSALSQAAFASLPEEEKRHRSRVK